MSTQELDKQWDELIHITRTTIDQYRPQYEELLRGVCVDRATPKGEAILGLYRAPASKDRHHAFEGGLVAHLLEMWNCWHTWRSTILRIARGCPITDQLVWRAILHHDLNKVWRYKEITKDKDGDPVYKWTVEYTEANEDARAHLLPDVYKSLSILTDYAIPVSPLLMNALITSEGGFSSGPRPKTETVFAKLVYLLDEMSANVLNRLETNHFWDSKDGGLSDPRF